MDWEKHRDKSLADNEELQELLLEVMVKRYWHHDKKRGAKDKGLAQSYLRRANELAHKYDLLDFLKNLLYI